MLNLNKNDQNGYFYQGFGRKFWKKSGNPASDACFTSRVARLAILRLNWNLDFDFLTLEFGLFQSGFGFGIKKWCLACTS